MKQYQKSLSDFRKEERVFNQGLRLRDEGQLEEAAQIFKEIASRHPRVAAPLGVLGGIYNELGRFTEAAKFYREAVRINPKSELGNIGLSNALWSMDKKDEAIAVLREYTDLTGSDSYSQLLEAYNQRKET